MFEEQCPSFTPHESPLSSPKPISTTVVSSSADQPQAIPPSVTKHELVPLSPSPSSSSSSAMTIGPSSPKSTNSSKQCSSCPQLFNLLQRPKRCVSCNRKLCRACLKKCCQSSGAQTSSSSDSDSSLSLASSHRVSCMIIPFPPPDLTT